MTRIAVIEREKCFPQKCGFLCAKKCPVNREDQECITLADYGKAQIDELLCTGCGICPKICPFHAISIINLPQELNTKPIHRYGQNMFALYNLPTPIFGKVVGIIGVNGIGKSTAMRILSGVLKPNLGDFSLDPNQGVEWDEIIAYFKGSEAQAFFERLRDTKIKVSFKPQEVDFIPKQFDGTVKQLLDKVSEKPEEFDRIIETLELNKILDRDIKHISGGELQRVAIAATTLKKANVYFFDEPTSYLDIKQRLKVSKFIRSLVNEDTGVMVVEHDLIILDYLSDFIHIMYGTPGVYGVSSQVRSTKAGINVYLSGYMKEENIRFRDHVIKFEKRAPVNTGRDELFCQWNPISTTLGNFKLEADKGDIYQHDVIGILGENGIGKTTFVKILAGEIENQSSLQNLKIAYKPQYLEKNDEPVVSLLKDLSSYRAVFANLKLESLLDKTLNQLSGGELQRVMIARTLMEEADLFLLDEPSAYLDVELRLHMAKVIKDTMMQKGKACLVVDHDLLFIDYLSEKLIVFQGEPAVHGNVTGPYNMQEGMNHFLKELKITFRRDDETNRPRANKEDSQLDREQKSSGKLYYS